MKYYELVYDHDGDDKKNNIYIFMLIYIIFFYLSKKNA